MTKKTVPFLLTLMVLLLLGGMLYPAQALGGALYPPLQGTLPPPTTPPPTYYEAETAEVGGGAEVQSNYTGFLGFGFVDFPADGGYVKFRNVHGLGGGIRVLRFRYSLGDTSSRTGTLTMNGAGQSITFSPTGAWTTWATKEVWVNLASGTTNTVRLQSTGQDLPLLDQLEVLPVRLIHQAETAEVGGGAEIQSNYTGYFGTGFVDFPADGGYVRFRNVSGVGGGIRVLRFRYSLGSTSSRTGTLTVNGAGQSITFSPTGAWTTWATKDVWVNLASGTTNTVRLQSTGQDLPLLDQLEVKW